MDRPEQNLHKPNASLVMVVRTGKLTGMARKLFDSVLLSSIAQLKEYRVKYGHDPDNKHLYSASASELLDLIEVNQASHSTTLRKLLLSLRRTEVDWEAPDAKSGVIWKNMSVLSQVELEIRVGQLYGVWALPPALNAAISDTRLFPFTKLDLVQISKLTSYTAVALYEICTRYKNNFLKGGNGVCLTNSSHPNWWIDAITNNLPKIDKSTGDVIRREWRKVKNESVIKAINEINQVTDLTIELNEQKEGRSISTVQFSIRPKRQPVKEIESSHFELIKQGIKSGLSQEKVEAALLSNTVDEVSLALAKLEARISQKELSPIDSLPAYFNSILVKDGPIKIVPDTAQTTKNSIKLLDNSEDGIGKSSREKIKEDFIAISDSKKQEYSKKALDFLKDRGMATPRIIMNAEGGVWSGALLSKMIDIFSEENHHGQDDSISND